MHSAPGFSEPLQQVDPTHVLWRGRRLVYFGGCDYLRLSFHPQIRRATREALARFGLNVAASRRTTGNHALYEQLERATEEFFAAERAIFVSNGYLTNIAVAQGLQGTIDQVFIDERAHSSLRDATVFLRCPSTGFAHRNPVDLRAKIGKHKNRRRVAVLTDGMFAHDGSIAPLADYRQVCGSEALLWVDDAHAAGILGRRGCGSVEEAGWPRRNLVQTITFSKAFGAYGGGILCGGGRATEIIMKSPAVAGNTPAPLPVAAAALRALEICRKEPQRREKLWRNVALFWEQIGQEPDNGSPIVALVTPQPANLQRRLLAEDIHPPFIQYGSGPVAPYFRFALSSEHSAEQIKRLARALAASLKHAEKPGKAERLSFRFDV